MHISRTLSNLSAISLWAVFLAGCQPKDLPLPESEQGLKTATGKIIFCDIKPLGRWGITIFVGLRLKAIGAPYIRFNIPSEDTPQYERWCSQNANVTITYKAKSTVMRPEITYWAESIVENET